MSVTFDSDFDDPFLDGSTGAATGTPYYLPVSIGSHNYLIDLKQYKRQTLPALRDPVDQSSEPGEQSLNTQGLWPRGQSDWRFGSGQQYLDEEGASRRRIYSSKGVDLWTEKQVTLLNDTERKASIASLTPNRMLVVNGYLYVTYDVRFSYTSNPSSASPTWVAGNAGTTISSITTDGTYIFIATGSTLQRAAVGSATVAAFGSLTPNVVSYVNGRLLGSNNNRIYEISAAGAVGTLDYSHPNSSFVWAGMISTPHGIYAWGSKGDISEVYFIGINSSTGALLTPVYAGGLPVGEALYILEVDQGALLWGTSLGFRVAKLNETASFLDYGPLVPIPGGVRGFDARGGYVWFTWTNYDSTSTGLGRIDLTRFSDDLVPAYASDLMTSSALTIQGTVWDVVTVGSRRYFVVDGDFLYGEITTKVPSGTFRTGKITYGTFVPKVAASIDLQTAALPAGASVTVSIAGDDGVFTDLDIFNITAAMGPDGLIRVLPAEKNQMIELQFTLTRATDTTTGPTIRRWTLLSMATPPRTDEIIVPLIVRSEVETEQMQPTAYNTLGEFQYLKHLEAVGDVIPYVEGRTTYEVYLDAVQLLPEKWDDNYRFFEGSILVRLLTAATR